MGERTLNFGTDATDADYQIRDSDPAGGDLIIEHQPTGATFEYDATENAWVPTDPIGSTNRRAPGVVSDSVDAQSVNNVRYADPGEVQTKIDDIASDASVGTEPGDTRGIVQLNPQQTYTGDWSLKPGIHLAGPALVQPDTDTNVLFCDNGTTFGVYGGPIIFDLTNLGTFSSAAVVLDTSQSTGPRKSGIYATEQSVKGHFEVYGDRTAGQTGLLLDDSGGSAITIGNEFRYTIDQCDKAVDCVTTSAGYINGVRCSGLTRTCPVHYNHQGVNDAECKLYIEDAMVQVGGITGETVMQNNTTANSMQMWGGQVYDINLAESQLLMAGPNLNAQIVEWTVLNGNMRDAGDGSTNQGVISTDGENFILYDLERASDATWNWTATGGFQFEVNGTTKYQVRNVGFTPNNLWLQDNPIRGLNEIDNATAGDGEFREIYLDKASSPTRLIIRSSDGNDYYFEAAGTL